MVAGDWVPLGGHQEVSTERQMAMRGESRRRIMAAERKHAHLFVATVAYYITVPPVEGALLDAESMMMEPAVGCFRCETEYTPGMESRRCPGEPADSR